jgi:hypothetical protein
MANATYFVWTFSFSSRFLTNAAVAMGVGSTPLIRSTYLFDYSDQTNFG